MGRKEITCVLIKLRKIEGRIIRIFLFYILRLFRLNPQKVVFSVYYGNGYGDNPKYIAEEILKQNLHYDLVWLLRKENMNQHALPPGIRPVRIDSLRAIYELVTARVWVDNHLKPVYVRKRKDQFYVQTSHGLPCLKRLEFENFVQYCKLEARKIDLFLSNSQWTSSVIEKDLWYNGEILECGAPRNDIFFATHPDVNDRVRKHFNIGPNQKIVLYAPTWRPHYDLSKYTFDIDMCLTSLSERFSGDWIPLVRHHPAVQDRSLGIIGSSNVIDASQYEDMQELLAISDVVVTDYSSLLFDFAVRRLPVFLYTPDVDAYRKERGFYFSEDELPFLFARSNIQLATIVREFNESSYIQQLNQFFESIGTFEYGNAAQATVRRIEAHLVQGHSIVIPRPEIPKA